MGNAKLFNVVVFAVILFSIFVSFAYAVVNHPASEVTAGTFGAGNFTVNGSLTAVGEIYGNLNASYILNPYWLISYNETDPLFVAENTTLWNSINGKLNATDQRFNETNIVNSKVAPGNCSSGYAVQNTTTSGVQCVSVSITEQDPLYVAGNSTIARIGDCPAGQVVVNTTTNGVQCVNKEWIMTTNGDGVKLANSSSAVVIGSYAPAANTKLALIGGGLEIANALSPAYASIFINEAYGGYGRLTQMSPSGFYKPALNIMTSTGFEGALNNWAWGVNNNSLWSIQPGLIFNGSTGFFINEAGNVGIGTTTPYYALSVNGTINSATETGKGYFVLGDPLDPSKYVGMWRGAPYSVNAGNDLNLQGYDGINLMVNSSTFGNAPIGLRISPGGLVGIGTTSPAGPLNVKGSVSQTLTLERPSNTINDATGVVYRLLDASSNTQDYAAIYGGVQSNQNTIEKGYLSLQTSNNGALAERMRITAEGYVGIGTADPSPSKLTLQGNSQCISDEQFSIRGASSPTKQIRIGYDTTGNRGCIQAVEMGVGATSLSINSAGGNVGIGTSAPGAKLEIVEPGTTALRIRPNAGVAGSIDLFVVKGDATTRTGTVLCQAMSATSLCMGYWTSAGALSACGTTITNGRVLCSDFGD